jgi:hypothetical protein
MSIFSSIGNLFSKGAGLVSKVVAKATPFVTNLSKGIQKVTSGYVKTVAPITDLFAPGLAETVSSFQDAIGNKVFGQADDYDTAAGDYGSDSAMAASVALDEPAQAGRAYLGSSPAAVAASNALATSSDASANRAVIAETSKSGFLGKLSEITGIGDKKPGVFGIGTGKGAARRQAEDAARGAGLSPRAVSVAGQQAANSVPARVNGTSSSADSDEKGTSPVLIGGGLLLLLKLLF